MTADLFSLAAERKLRDEGMERAMGSAYAQNWLAIARNVAVRMLMIKQCPSVISRTISADELLSYCPRPPNVSPNATGSLFKDKRFKLVGYKQSTKTSAHARRIAVWSLNDEVDLK